MELKDSKTFKNLFTSYTGEVQAHARYLFFSDKAKEEGYQQIAEIFKYTAENELSHAKVWFNHLCLLDQTEKNLETAINGENFEWTDMYKEFKETALEEGFPQIAKLFENIASIEKTHEERFKEILKNLEDNTVFSELPGNK